MNKIRYLVGKPPNRKLKRNVPVRLVELAGKTAWTRRLAGLSETKIREAAGLFAVYTDSQIAMLARRFEQRQQFQIIPSDEAPSVEITSSEAKQLALIYFSRRKLEMEEFGPPRPDYDKKDGIDPILELGEEIAELISRLQQRRITGYANLVSVFQESGHLPQRRFTRDERKAMGDEFRKSERIGELALLIMRADLELLNRQLHSYSHGKANYVRDSFFHAAASTDAANHLPFRERIENHQRYEQTLGVITDEFVQSKREEVTYSRLNQYEIPIRAMHEWFGKDKVAADITKQELADLCKFLPRIPAYSGREKSVTLETLANNYKKTHGEFPARYDEAKKHLQVIVQIMRFAAVNDWIPRNLAEAVEIKVPKKFRLKKYEQKELTIRPFEMHELTKLFSCKWYTNPKRKLAGRNHLYWLPLIGIFTGARSNEILQLERSDIVCTPDNYWYFSITDEEHADYSNETYEKQVKTKQSVRDIPVHPMLIDAGLIEWVERVDSGRLFPEAPIDKSTGKASKKYSEKFRIENQGLGIWVKHRKVFHSLRNNFNDGLRDARISAEYREALNGWSYQRSMDRRYGRGVKIGMLFEELAKLKFEDVDWSTVLNWKERFDF